MSGSLGEREMLWEHEPQANGKRHSVHHLTNRFHVAVHLLSNKSQMTSKCGKNNKVVEIRNT